MGRYARRRRGCGKAGRANKKLTARVTFDVEKGDRAQWLIEVAAENGVEIPEEDLAPPLLYECEFVYRAFWELSTDRHIGMGQGRIPWSSINAYASRYGLDDLDEFDRFASLIRAADAAYLKSCEA